MMPNELCKEGLTGPARSLWTEAHTKSRTPGRLIGKTRQNEECAASILPAVAGALKEFNRHRATVECVNNPFGLMAEATRRPAGDHRQMPAQAEIFFEVDIHWERKVLMTFKQTFKPHLTTPNPWGT